MKGSLDNLIVYCSNTLRADNNRSVTCHGHRIL